MTQEDKELLLKDLCARLPYGVKMKYIFDDGSYCPFELSTKILQECIDKGFLPYLRPMSSITDDEMEEMIQKGFGADSVDFSNAFDYINWLNEHHFDYNGLIEKGLAIEAPEGMYDIH